MRMTAAHLLLVDLEPDEVYDEGGAAEKMAKNTALIEAMAPEDQAIALAVHIGMPTAPCAGDYVTSRPASGEATMTGFGFVDGIVSWSEDYPAGASIGPLTKVYVAWTGTRSGYPEICGVVDHAVIEITHQCRPWARVLSMADDCVSRRRRHCSFDRRGAHT
jgi:hypothetical protein